MKTGYHFTPLVNWKFIKKEGLETYLIDKKEINVHFDYPIYGIWLFKNKPTKLDSFYRLITNFIEKRKFCWVLLEVKYSEKDTLFAPKNYDLLKLTHEIKLNGWVYNEEKGDFVIVLNIIVPKKIKVVKRYNLLKMIQ